MKTDEKILKEIQTLPHQMQEETLDFIFSFGNIVVAAK